MKKVLRRLGYTLVVLIVIMWMIDDYKGKIESFIAAKQDEGYTYELGLNTNSEEELSEAELWELINSQPVYVEKMAVLSAYLKEDCLLSAIFWNNSGKDIRDVVIVYLAWDENGLPLLLGSDYEGATYDVGCNYEGINMPTGTSFGEGTGRTVYGVAPEEVETISAIMYSYTDFEGKVYYNPYFEEWLLRYGGKKL